MSAMIEAPTDLTALFERAGLAAASVAAWRDAAPPIRKDRRADSAACSNFWALGKALLGGLPAKAARNPDQAQAGETIHRECRKVRERLLAAHVEALYDALTADRTAFLRVDALVERAAKLVPGLTPDASELAAESARTLKEKEGLEFDHGILLSHVLAHPALGSHLCHAMLLPRVGSHDLLAQFAKDGSVDLGTAHVSRMGKAAVVELRNPAALNALDETTLAPLETAIDIAILDSATDIAVLRGGKVDHPKYRGRRIFSAGINLTHLYRGRIPFLFYFDHVMGYENKMLRGVAMPDASVDDVAGRTIEKPWIAAVDGFAIGGGCQHLLVMDYVLAAAGSYLTLPARKEGIIPGLANLRLPRFVGDRLARQAIMYGRKFDCDSVEGRLICDEIAPVDRMDDALAAIVEGLTGSGLVSAVGNRCQIRIGQEPLDLFRGYLARYAREQAACHFGSGLIANLERHWNAQSR